jgi:hypothetical protein
MRDTKLTDALEYAARGYFIVPFTPDGLDARPLVPLTNASKNPDKIRQWWMRWQNADVGCSLDRNCLMIVEVNCEAGHRIAGEWAGAGRCPFKCDGAALTVIVRQVSPAAQRKLFQQLTHKEGV